jgi:hypothetical protein
MSWTRAPLNLGAPVSVLASLDLFRSEQCLGDARWMDLFSSRGFPGFGYLSFSNSLSWKKRMTPQVRLGTGVESFLYEFMLSLLPTFFSN